MTSKRVVYRGGIASFDIPTSWVEEYVPEGGGTFYEDRLEIHRWEVAVPVLPHTVRIAIFSYTILAGQQKEPHIATELQMVDAAIRNATFSTERGVAGSYEHQGDTIGP